MNDVNTALANVSAFAVAQPQQMAWQLNQQEVLGHISRDAQG
jgi:hypothetical protein